LDRYYKTDVLITGFDIIFFWVARMMMQGIHFMDGEVPFHTVYINSIVVDAKGKKMSKSLGNIIDPLELIDQYGADAVRFTLASQEVQGKRTLRLAVDQVEASRNFGTKLWNAASFSEMNDCRRDPDFDPKAVSRMVNKWIVGETARAASAAQKALEAYRFNDAALGLYAHIRGTFCDWYLEFSKPLLQGNDEAAKAETRATMSWALDQCLVLLHPIMPFITEELWGILGERDGPLMLSDWPDLGELSDPVADREIGWVIRLIEGVRSVRAEMGVKPSEKLELVLTGHSPEVAMRLLRNAALVQRLAGLRECAVAELAPEGSVTLALEDCSVNLPLKGVVDVAAEGARLEKAKAKLSKEAGGLSAKLANEKFLAKAPEDVVAEQRVRLEAAEAEIAKLDAALDRLRGLA
ncbi:MAG: class I tRNA ligase family protein, partial [Pseudomonadota bacterium]